MYTIGLDIGAGSTKSVLMENGEKIIAKTILPTKGNPTKAAEHVIHEILTISDLKRDDISYLCTTGFGRYTYEDRDLQVSDITASGRGAIYLFPKTRHVVDIGTQSTRAIAVNERGKVLKFKMNEKCAAGAGRFIERCSKYLQVSLDSMGPIALDATNPKIISSVCAVLSETEIINYVAEGIPIQDIIMGIFLSLSQRAQSLMKYVGIEPEVTLVGGLVHNIGLVHALKKVTGTEINVSPDSHYAAAIGSAILGYIRAKRMIQV